MTESDVVDRATGAFLGVACGDALGRPVASLSSAAIAAEYGRLTDVRAGPGGTAAGTTTVHTRSLLAAARALADGDPVPPLDADAPGTAAFARTPAVAVRHRTHDRDALATAAAADAAADPALAGGAVALAVVLASLVGGAAGEAAADAALDLAVDRGAPGAVREALVGAGDRALVALDTTGPAAVLETGLHDGLTGDDVDAAVTAAVNRGGEAPALGAVAGAVAGARHGVDAVPPRWLNALDDGLVAELRTLADRLATGG